MSRIKSESVKVLYASELNFCRHPIHKYL